MFSHMSDGPTPAVLGMTKPEDENKLEMPAIVLPLFPDSFYVPPGVAGENVTVEGRLFDDDQVDYIEYVFAQAEKDGTCQAYRYFRYLPLRASLSAARENLTRYNLL